MTPVIDPSGGRSAGSWADAIAALPQAEEWPPRGRLAVVAPHPDDEVLGVGGALAVHARAGGRVDVVTVTDGEACWPDLDEPGRRALARRRREESRAAHRHLGLVVTRHDLGLPDGDVAGCEDRLATALRPVLERVAAVAVVVADDGHPDHDATGRVTGRVAAAVGVQVVRYAVWAWNWDPDTSGRLAGATRVVLPGPDRARKRSAVRAHASQVRPRIGRPAILPPTALAHHLGPVEVVWADAR